MRMAVLALPMAWALLACAASASEGRWEGTVRIPERALAVVVDLARDKAGDWNGSITFPGLGIKGAALTNIVVIDTAVAFNLAGVLGNDTYGAAALKGRLLSADTMAGDMHQAGNTASFSLRRTGPPQVDLPPGSTPISAELQGRWEGSYELGGYPRKVTVELVGHGAAAASARWVIVGKQTTELPVDLVIQDGASLRIESTSRRAVFEGRFFAGEGELRGVLELGGAMEMPLVLRLAMKDPA